MRRGTRAPRPRKRHQNQSRIDAARWSARLCRLCRFGFRPFEPCCTLAGSNAKPKSHNFPGTCMVGMHAQFVTYSWQNTTFFLPRVISNVPGVIWGFFFKSSVCFYQAGFCQPPNLSFSLFTQGFFAPFFVSPPPLTKRKSNRKRFKVSKLMFQVLRMQSEWGLIRWH